MKAILIMGEKGPLKLACKSWQKYKGKSKPRCCNGNGCIKCWEIYEKAKGM